MDHFAGRWETHAGVKKPDSTAIVKFPCGEEYDKKRHTYENDGVVEIHFRTTETIEIEPHDQTKEEEEEARQLCTLSCLNHQESRKALTSASCFQSRW